MVKLLVSIPYRTFRHIDLLKVLVRRLLMLILLDPLVVHMIKLLVSIPYRTFRHIYILKVIPVDASRFLSRVLLCHL